MKDLENEDIKYGIALSFTSALTFSKNIKLKLRAGSEAAKELLKISNNSQENTKRPQTATVTGNSGTGVFL